MFAKKGLKREDFLIENGWFDHLVRAPGQLHMQQFQISDCQECTICLFDSSAGVYIDDCKYCLVFIGACQSSVFIRNCTYVTVVCTTQQFRVRDCVNCHFALFCQSQPVIESSQKITISNFPLFGYSQMTKQMIQAKTTPWNNNWFDIFDFTPHKFGTQNYQLAPMSDQQEREIRRKVQEKMEEIGLQESQPIIPRVLGGKDRKVEEFCVFVAYPVPPTLASQHFQLLQSRVHMIMAQQLRQLGVKQANFEGRTKVLFVKILRKHKQKWRQNLKNIVLQVTSIQKLQLYQGVVFAPFKDDH